MKIEAVKKKKKKLRIFVDILCGLCVNLMLLCKCGF
jgi:hypothetical protein